MATVSGFTALSRILGFVRDILMGYFLGSSHAADAFFAAFKFPNIFRRIFGEGAFNSAFVPLFSKELTAKGQKEAMGHCQWRRSPEGVFSLFYSKKARLDTSSSKDYSGSFESIPMVSDRSFF